MPGMAAPTSHMRRALTPALPVLVDPGYAEGDGIAPKLPPAYQAVPERRARRLRRGANPIVRSVGTAPSAAKVALSELSRHDMTTVHSGH